MNKRATPSSPGPTQSHDLREFTSPLLNLVRSSGGILNLRNGQVRLPRVFGFCRGVERALTLADRAVQRCAEQGKRIFLLGQIIHNPWVNRYLQQRGATILSRAERRDVEKYVTRSDCAVIPAFGVPPDIHRRLEQIGCEIVDSTCGDVLRLWTWAQRAVASGHGVLVYGKPNHDETLVTKRRLAEAGGHYLVLSDLEMVRRFCDAIAAGSDQRPEAYSDDQTNADDLRPFVRLAQVSQTTMLYGETMTVQQLIREAFATRWPGEHLEQRLLLQPTVCKATQQRQQAAVELCKADCDCIVVVGGAGSSNTRHLYELARSYAPSWFIEDHDSIGPDGRLLTCDVGQDHPGEVPDWLGDRRPVCIGLLAGASTPEVVVGNVLQRLAALLD